MKDLRPDPPNLQQDLLKALQGEYEAILNYEKLAALAPNNLIQKKIIEIQKDEKKHFQLFAYLLKQWFGTEFHAAHAPAPVSTYENGLLSSIIDEQETVDFYYDLAEQVSDQKAKAAIMRAAADEQNHAVWFLLFHTLQR